MPESLSEQVAALEAERDVWMANFKKHDELVCNLDAALYTANSNLRSAEAKVAAQRTLLDDAAAIREHAVATARVEGALAWFKRGWNDALDRAQESGGLDPKRTRVPHRALGEEWAVGGVWPDEAFNEHPAPSAHAGEATRYVSGSIGFKVMDSSPVREAVRVQGNVVTIDCDAVREMAERADRNAAITSAASLRVGGSCADCQALNHDASVTWKFCPNHTLHLRASESGDTAQGSRVDFRTLDNRGVKEVLSDSAPTPEPKPPLVRLDVEQGTMAVFVTPADCRRIVALGSRPTQTAEG